MTSRLKQTIKLRDMNNSFLNSRVLFTYSIARKLKLIPLHLKWRKIQILHIFVNSIPLAWIVGEFTRENKEMGKSGEVALECPKCSGAMYRKK